MSEGPLVTQGGVVERYTDTTRAAHRDGKMTRGPSSHFPMSKAS